MNSYVFASPYLKFNSEKIFILSDENDLNDTDYENNTFYIDADDIEKNGSFIIDDKVIYYNILSYENDKNLIFKLDIDYSQSGDEGNIIKIMYALQLYVAKNDNFLEMSSLINDDIIKKYSEKYFKL